MKNALKNKTGFKTRLTICVFVIFAFILNLCFGVMGSVTAFADGSDRTVKACIFKFDGYHMKDEDDNLTGYGIEFLNLVSQYSHLNFRYDWYESGWVWDDIKDEEGNVIEEGILTKLTKGEVDVVTSVSRIDGRDTFCDFSLPIGRKRTVLSIHVNDTQHHRGDYSTYNGMKIGLLKGNANSQNKILREFAEGKFTYNEDESINYYYDDDVKLAAALQAHEVDAILSSDLRKTENEKTLDILEDDYFYAVVKKGNTELLDEINYAIEQMDINEGDWQNNLKYKYYGTVYSSDDPYTDREKEYIQQVVSGQKSITVTASGYRAPYSYTENGELKGIMPDYFDQLMKIPGLPYSFVVPQDQNDYKNLVSTNAVNVVIDNIGAEGTKAGAVYNGYNTDDYMTARITMVSRQDFNGTITSIAVLTPQRDYFAGRGFLKGYNEKTYDTEEEIMNAVLKREVDAAYVYAYTAQLIVNRDTSKTLFYSMMNGMSTTFNIHVSENTDHELITILNKCIKQLSSDTLNQLALKHTSYTVEDISFGEYLLANPVIIVAVVFVLVLILGAILVLYLRGQWSNKLLHTTEKANQKMGEQLAIVEALSRDYTNVYAINEEQGAARILKLEGYVPEGIDKDSVEEYNYATVLGVYIKNRVHPEDQEELTQLLSLDAVKEKLEISDEYQGSYRILDDDEIHHFQFTYLKIADGKDGHGGFILAGFRNIDDVIRKEQEQKNILADALARAQYANKAKTTFLNNMSHDIRTPMNAIIGFTALAATHIDNKEQIKDYLSKITTSGNHLLSLINDVLDMSRIESGKVKIEEKEASLPEIMHDLKTIVQSDVQSKQLEFYVDTLDVTNETIICDKLRLNQVLLNILSNAMKYTKPGGMVSVRVIQKGEAQNGYASFEFRVKDTGIGMSKEFLKHVFEPFEREQTSTVSGIQGTGLGLAITKNIVDMMGGTISVESEEGKGSEFIVNLRFRVTDAPAKMQRVEQLENLRALVVDDDVDSCVSVSKMLTSIGMRPDWTTLGHEALIRTKLALEQKEPYAAYIIDWLMPDMNGIELARRVRRVVGDTAPVIILTAYDWTDIEKEAKEAGVTAFCSKPIFFSELRSVLAAPYEEQKRVEEVEEEELRFDGKKILLVEDNELNQEIAQTVLEAAGFVVDTADDGSVAVECMKEKPAGTYDLILMDVQMPIMNGYDATRAIRALDDSAKSAIPIVAMTANAFEEDKKEAIDAGMNGYAAKPIDIAKLMQLLKEILK